MPVGMPSVHQHRGKGCQIWDGPKKSNANIRESRLTFQHGREPESKAVKNEIIKKGYRSEQQYRARLERLSHVYRLHRSMLFFVQLLLDPLPVFKGEPGRFA